MRVKLLNTPSIAIMHTAASISIPPLPDAFFSFSWAQVFALGDHLRNSTVREDETFWGQWYPGTEYTTLCYVPNTMVHCVAYMYLPFNRFEEMAQHTYRPYIRWISWARIELTHRHRGWVWSGYSVSFTCTWITRHMMAWVYGSQSTMRPVALWTHTLESICVA